jgi:hypothetical protein
LPIRIHDLLLSLAGQLDDDALADVRQMLASAELDRSLEFLAGCLAAGRIVLASAQHRELESLFADTYLDPSVIDRVLVSDRDAGRHRFAVGSVDGLDPARGVADAVRPVLDVLPDVRSMWCVWRLTPAGPASGPVPHLLVLVGIGPGGFPPATAYRVEHALRRAGIRASVEVLMDGVEPGDYHREAMRNARQLPFDGHGSSHPRVEPAGRPVAFESSRPEPARIAPSRVEPPRLDAPRVSAIPPEPPMITSDPPRMAAEPRMSSDSPRFVADPPADSARFGTDAPATTGDSPRVGADSSRFHADQPGTPGDARFGTVQPGDSARFGSDQPGDSARFGSDLPGAGDSGRFGTEQPGVADRSQFGTAQPGDSARFGSDLPGAGEPGRFSAEQPGVSERSRFGTDQPGDARFGAGRPGEFGADRSGAPDGSRFGAAQPGDSARFAADPSGPSGDASRFGAAQAGDRATFAADQPGTSRDPLFGDHPGMPGDARLSADPPRISAVPDPARSAQPPGVDAPRIDSPHVELPVRKAPPGVDPQVPPPFSTDSPHTEPPNVDPPTTVTPVAGGLVGPGGLVGGAPDLDQEPPPRIEAVRSDPFTKDQRPAPEFEQERAKDEPPPQLPPSALREETRTDSAPPPRRSRASTPDDDEPQTKEHPSRPNLAPANGADKHSQAFVDDILNTQERNLLQELQDELARREQQDTQPPIGNNSGPWRVDRSGRHGKPAGGPPFEHPNQTTGPMIINGVPPHPDKRGYPPAN